MITTKTSSRARRGGQIETYRRSSHVQYYIIVFSYYQKLSGAFGEVMPRSYKILTLIPDKKVLKRGMQSEPPVNPMKAETGSLKPSVYVRLRLWVSIGAEPFTKVRSRLWRALRENQPGDEKSQDVVNLSPTKLPAWSWNPAENTGHGPSKVYSIIFTMSSIDSIHWFCTAKK